MLDLPIHPMTVQFPIALLFTAILFDAEEVGFTRDNFRYGALWFLILGFLGVVATTIAGVWTEDVTQQTGIAEWMMETHETLVLVSLGLSGMLLAWRLTMPSQDTRKTLVPYVLIIPIGLGTLSATIYYAWILFVN